MCWASRSWSFEGCGSASLASHHSHVFLTQRGVGNELSTIDRTLPGFLSWHQEITARRNSGKGSRSWSKQGKRYSNSWQGSVKHHVSHRLDSSLLFCPDRKS